MWADIVPVAPNTAPSAPTLRRRDQLACSDRLPETKSRTGGQVLGGGNFSVGHGFVLRFPAAGWYTWPGAIIQGKGVEPDVDVPLSAEGLRQGRDNQLETAIAAVEAMPRS